MDYTEAMSRTPPVSSSLPYCCRRILHPLEGMYCPMSHHLDTPLASQNGQLYVDDLFVVPGNSSAADFVGLDGVLIDGRIDHAQVFENASGL